MRIEIVPGEGPDHAALRAFVGFILLLVSDMLWIGFISKYFDVYDSYLSSEHNSRSRLAAGLILYAATASGVASVFSAPTPGDAAAGGALVGLWVFFAYNITTFATTSGRYPLRTVVIDTVYGICVTAALFATQHAVAGAA